MNLSKGVFTISLDFELYWGIFSTVKLEDRLQYFANTRATIPKKLQLFDKYKTHVTWAAVGMLFLENWDEWESLVPANKPQYANEAVDAYRLKNMYGHRKELEYCFFAPQLVKTIIGFENQELGTHTYSHYFCQEPGQTVQSFDDDLRIAVQLAARLGVSLKSLVFPRNQIRPDYLDVCLKHGIETVRSNPADWFWKETGKETLSKKIFRTGDAFVPMGINKSYDLSALKQADDEVLQLPASRFLRPYGTKDILNKLRLQRILAEMEFAAENNKCYHLWWHPHNFGGYPEQSLEGLEVILKKYTELNQKCGMQSLTMDECNRFVNSASAIV